jgi:hypothetical protein
MTRLEKAKIIAERIINADSKTDYFDGGSEQDPVELIGEACGDDTELCNLVYGLVFYPEIIEL